MQQSTFPSTEGLQTSSDGKEYIYGGSIAINRILGLLRDTAGHGSLPYQLWLINTYTLFENVFDSTKRPSDIINAFHAEVNILTQYIEAYVTSAPGVTRAPDIVFYSPIYDIIPPKLRREVKDTTKSGNNRLALDKLYRSFRATELSARPERLTRPNGQSNIWSVPVGQGSYPHRALAEWLRQQTQALSYVAGQDLVALITHCPIDLHIHRYVSGVRLLERYTGEVVLPSGFGKKLDHSGNVPFNIYTHQVFGDKVHLNPLILPKQKRELLAIAEKRIWKHRSQQDIFKDIRDATGIKSEALVLKL